MEVHILQTLVEQAPIGMVMLDRAMRHIQVSGRWLNDVASTREKTIGKSHYECSPRLPAKFHDAHRRGLLGETVLGLDDSFMRPDGAVRKVNWRVVPWGDFGETTGGIIIYAEDVTERREMELLARQRDLKYRALFENMNEALIYCEVVSDRNQPFDFVFRP